MTKSRNIHKPHIINICLECGKEFEVLYCRRSRKFCCYDCSVKYSIGKKHWWTPPSVFKKGHKPSLEVRKKMSENRKGKGGLRGKKHPRWKDKKYKRYIHKCWTKSYKKWREAVFKRDDWTCQKCLKKGGTLNAHHIKSWVDNPKLRYTVYNGITLCIKCHRLVHKKITLNKKICQQQLNKKEIDLNTK